MRTVKQLLEKKSFGQDHLSKMDTKRSAAYPSEKEIPTVIVLKRKAIRVFPDNQKIAMYYSQALDKYISIPYGPKNDALGMHLSESKKEDRPIDTSEVDPDVLADDDVQDILDKKRPIKVTTKDILDKLPVTHPLNIKRGFRNVAGRAIRDYQRKKKSGAETTGTIIGAGIVGAARGVKKAAQGAKRIYQRLTKESFDEETDIRTSFRDKLEQIREEQEPYLAERFVPRLPAPKSSLPAKPGGNSGIPAKPGKTKKPLWKTRRRKKKKGSGAGGAAAGAAAGYAAGSGNNATGSGDGESAYDAAKRRGREAITPSSQYDFGSRDLTRASQATGARERTDVQFGLTPITTVGRRQQQQESSNLSKIRMVSENKNSSDKITIGENDITINNRVAKKIMKLYESLNKQNREKLETMLNENAIEARKIINFAIKV